MENFKIKTKLEESDYKNFYFDYLFKGSIFKNIVFVILFLFVYECILRGQISTYSIIVGISVGILLFVVFTFLDFVLNTQRLLKEYESNSLAKDEHIYTFSDEGINKESIKTNSTFTWKDIYKIKETRNAFFILYSKKSPMVLPKRYFSNEKEIINLRELFISKLDRSRIKLLKNQI